MPKWPIAILVVASVGAWMASRRKSPAPLTGAPLDEGVAEATPSPEARPATIEVLLGARLSEAWQALKPMLSERIAALRAQQEKVSGVAFPAVMFQDGAHLDENDYDINLFGARHGHGRIFPDRTFAIRSGPAAEPLSGIEARDPAFGLPGYWIENDLRERAVDAGYNLVDPITVVITHLGDVLRTEAPLLLARADVVNLLEGVRTRQPGLVEELIPAIMTVSDIQRVLQNLLAEEVSIRNIDLIAEALLDVGRQTKDITELTELTRQKLSFTIFHQLRGSRDELAVLSLNPRVELQIADAVRRSDGKGALVIDPSLAEQFLRKLLPLVDTMLQQSLAPVLLCGPDIRRHLKAFTRRAAPRLAIVSVNEVPHTIDLKSFAVLNIE